MPNDDNDRRLFDKLEIVQGAVAAQTGAIQVLKNEVDHNSNDIEKLKDEVNGIHRDKVSKREFDTFKGEIYKPTVDNQKTAQEQSAEELKEIRKKIYTWTGIGIVIVWVFGIILPWALGLIKIGVR